jgi:hypothetical protein
LVDFRRGQYAIDGTDNSGVSAILANVNHCGEVSGAGWRTPSLQTLQQTATE